MWTEIINKQTSKHWEITGASDLWLHSWESGSSDYREDLSSLWESSLSSPWAFNWLMINLLASPVSTLAVVNYQAINTCCVGYYGYVAFLTFLSVLCYFERMLLDARIPFVTFLNSRHCHTLRRREWRKAILDIKNIIYHVRLKEENI